MQPIDNYATPSSTFLQCVESRPKSVRGGEVNNINFGSIDAFAYFGKQAGACAIRCAMSYNTVGSGPHAFQQSYNGGL